MGHGLGVHFSGLYHDLLDEHKVMVEEFREVQEQYDSLLDVNNDHEKVLDNIINSVNEVLGVDSYYRNPKKITYDTIDDYVEKLCKEFQEKSEEVENLTKTIKDLESEKSDLESEVKSLERQIDGE